MDSKLIAIVTILITLSVASERLVEIIKGFLPKLSEENLESNEEAKRKAKVAFLAVICGIITAFLASPILAGIFKDIFAGSTCKMALGFVNLGENTPCGFDFSGNGIFLVIALGLLASGGSSMWNSILEYLLKIKDLRKIEVAKANAMMNIEIAQANELRSIEVAKANDLRNVEVEIAKSNLPPPNNK